MKLKNLKRQLEKNGAKDLGQSAGTAHWALNGRFVTAYFNTGNENHLNFVNVRRENDHSDEIQDYSAGANMHTIKGTLKMAGVEVNSTPNDSLKLKAELVSRGMNVRSVKQGTGSMRGVVVICCALYDDPLKVQKYQDVRKYMESNYPKKEVCTY